MCSTLITGEIVMIVTWNKHGGYECSTRGDKRFSAFNAIMPDGRSIEQHYQCDVKGHDVGGTNWRKGKGKPPVDKTTNTWFEYLKLWRTWADNNPELMGELKQKVSEHDYHLSDRFATTPTNQAHALARILSENWDQY